MDKILGTLLLKILTGGQSLQLAYNLENTSLFQQNGFVLRLL